MISGSGRLALFFEAFACGMASRMQSCNAIGYAKFRTRSHDAVIRVYDEAGNVIGTYEHKGDFKEW
jgi:hypothetical protein